MSVSVDLEDCVFVEDLAEPVLQSKVMRYHARLLEIMGQAVVAVDPNGKIAFWNEAAARLFGCAPSQMVGKRIREAFKDVIFENADAISKHMNRHEGWTGEATVKLSNGDRIATILSNKPIVNNGKYCGMVGVFTDVSNLKWMQEVLEEANEVVVQLNEKLRVVDSLTRHDLRNKLTTVNASVYVLKKRAQENKAALELLLEIEKVSKQMAQILEFQQYYVQVGMEELRNVDIEVYVREAAELFSDLKGIQLINNCHGLTLLADSLLRQLLYNLIDNTLKYGEKTSHIAVRFEKHKARLLLIYEDDGVGIADDVKGLLFTEGYGKGTGYGLYLIRRICENYGWTIEETGVAGKGAQFTMTVPEGSVNGKHRYYIC